MAAVGAALCEENCHDDRNHDLALPGFWVDTRGIRLSAPYATTLKGAPTRYWGMLL